MIAYYKLLDLLNRKGLKKIDLQRGIKSSPNTMAKISRNEYISLQNINEICKFLNCQPSDIIEYIPDNNDSETS